MELHRLCSRRERLRFEENGIWCVPVQRGVRTPAIVEVEVFRDGRSWLRDGVVSMLVYLLVLYRFPRSLDEQVSRQAPRPSTLISILCFRRATMKG